MTVGPNGELDMRHHSVGGGGSRPLEMRTAAAQIDNTGTLRARQIIETQRIAQNP